MNKRFLLPIILVGGLALVLTGLILFQPEADFDDTEPVSETLIGGQIDTGDCLVAAGYSWCETKGKCLRVFEEFCPDEANILVATIEAATGAKFTYTGEANFNWLINDDQISTATELAGSEFVISNLPYRDYELIEKYLNDNIEIDLANIANDQVEGLRGYRYNYMACALNFRQPEITDEAAALITENELVDVSLKCGFFNPNDLPKMILAEVMKELMAREMQRNLNEFGLEVEQATDNHVRGRVFFTDESGRPVAGAYFFAARVGNQWQIVEAGNGGIACEKMQSYDFPEEMITDCDEE